MPLITSTFFFYSMESLIAGVRKHRKTFKGFLFGNKFSQTNIRKMQQYTNLGGKQINNSIHQQTQ